jgi:hypothetical protein
MSIEKCYSYNGKEYYKEDFKEFIIDQEMVVGDTIYIADAVYTKPSELCDADDVIDAAKDRAYDLGEDWAEDYLDYVSVEAHKELTDLITAWLEKNGEITWFIAENVETRLLVESDFEV